MYKFLYKFKDLFFVDRQGKFVSPRHYVSVNQLILTIPIILGVGLLSVFPGSVVLAQEQRQIPGQLIRTVTVTGRGMESIPATIAQVSLGVEAQGKTAQEVQREVARRSTAVVELLRSRNVEKLQTTGIRLNPNYSYQNNVQRLIGYTAVNTVSFRIDTQRIGNLLDEAVKAGATRIDGISFVATDSAIAKAQEQALQKATLDAQRQANAVLAALNLKPQEVVYIQVNGASPPIAFRVRAAAAPPVGEAINEFSTPVVGGEQQVEAFVTLQIRY
ncbi:SIMPL domain-containing protein [Floridanema evergladense]|uniref:SIMPL domain-containing protein n=1 Tax=Floridaenema evergladense BLCC-F167 TaxID=3153639 RepID=A0ABV4WS77_9CYAN